jgi:hypothetical protein
MVLAARAPRVSESGLAFPGSASEAPQAERPGARPGRSDGGDYSYDNDKCTRR